MKELSFFEFTQLSKQQQYELVFNEGEYTDVAEIGESKYVLYKLYGFFVEVEYKIKENKIVNLVSYSGKKE